MLEKITPEMRNVSSRKHAYVILTLLNPLLSSLFLLRFYGLVNPMGSCRARSVYLATRFTGQA